jgi:programmed cell death 6-interacting protein
LHLPSYLTKRRTGESLAQGSISLPPQLWEKISHVQKLGGTVALNEIMQNIRSRYNYLVSNLENTLNSFKNEENDDNMNRQKYGTKWIRKSSNVLNCKYIQAIQNHLKNLQRTAVYDQRQTDEICNNAKYFEKISVPKAKLTNDIPGRIIGKKPENSSEAQLHEEILNLYDLSDKTSDIISPMYEQLNDDSLVLSMFVEVLEKTTTEQAIFNKNKEEYEKSFKELKEISEQILNQKKVINEIANKVVPELMKKQNEQKVGDEANEYFNELDKYANLYMNIYDKCKKGEDYYNNLQYKVDEVLAASNQWMIKRNEEKNALISALTKGLGNNGAYAGQSSQYQDSSAYLNPNENMYTNFNVNSGNKTSGSYKGSY